LNRNYYGLLKFKTWEERYSRTWNLKINKNPASHDKEETQVKTRNERYSRVRNAIVENPDYQIPVSDNPIPVTQLKGQRKGEGDMQGKWRYARAKRDCNVPAKRD